MSDENLARIHGTVDRIEPMLKLALAQLQAGDYTRCVGSLHWVIGEVRKLEVSSPAAALRELGVL